MNAAKAPAPMCSDACPAKSKDNAIAHSVLASSSERWPTVNKTSPLEGSRQQREKEGNSVGPKSGEWSLIEVPNVQSGAAN